MIPAWIACVALLMLDGVELGFASLIATLVTPIIAILVSMIVAAIKLSGEPRPDKESDWILNLVVWILIGAMLWKWLAN